MEFLYAYVRYITILTKISTSHGFVYENDFSQEEMSEYCGAIIDSISHAPIFLLEDKYRKLH